MPTSRPITRGNGQTSLRYTVILLNISGCSALTFCLFTTLNYMEVAIISKYINTKSDELVNENIRFREVLVIAQDGTQIGVKSRFDALKLAREAELDLVCVAPNAKTPVCRIMNYGKYRFEQQKKAKEAKKNQHVTEVKPIRLSPVIDKNDFDTKVRQASGWLKDGIKVKIDMRFRGRMMTRQEVGKKIMDDFIEALTEITDYFRDELEYVVCKITKR